MYGKNYLLSFNEAYNRGKGTKKKWETVRTTICRYFVSVFFFSLHIICGRLTANL